MKKRNLLMKMLLVTAMLCVGTNGAWADEINATLDHTAGAKWGSGYDGTYESTVDAQAEFYNSRTTNWQGAAYAKFSYTIPAGHSILSAVLTYSINQGGNNTSGYEQEIWYMKKDFDLDWANFAGQKNVDLGNESFRQATVSTASTGGKGIVRNLTVDVTNSIQSLYAEGQSYVLFQWTNNGGSANLFGKGSTGNYADYKPTLVITTTSAAAYNVTFSENNSVSATIKMGDTDVTNGTTLTNGNYSFTATAPGYENYAGNFTVNGADLNVPFTMTAKTTVSSVVVNYKYNETTIVSEAGSTTGKYVGETATIPFRAYIQKDGVLYNVANNSSDPYYGESTTLTANTVVNKNVTVVDLEGGILEHLIDLDGSTAQNAGIRASYLGSYENSAYTSDANIPAGVYTFMVRAYSRGRNSVIKVGDNELFAIKDVVGGSWSTGTKKMVVVPEEGKLMLAKGDGGTSIDPVDVIIAIRHATVSTTITSAGWATLYTPYALDFSGTGLTAYTATVSENTVTLNPVENVPANTGVVLKGNQGNYSIPVIASSSTEKGSLIGSAIDATACPAASGTYYILTKVGDKAQFNPATSGSIAAGKAFLHVGGSARTLSVVFADETTGVSDATRLKNNEESIKNGEVYNLAGQRVSQPTKGLYIVNGMKVSVK